MSSADWVWGGLLAVGLAYEIYTIRNAACSDTLSETVRKVFRVHTKPGRLIFLVAWTTFAVWFAFHIVS